MKTLLVAMCIVFVAIFVTGCNDEIQQKAMLQDMAKWNLEHTVYIKDSRSGICFAVMGNHSKVNISATSCEQIPASMLMVK